MWGSLCQPKYYFLNKLGLHVKIMAEVVEMKEIKIRLREEDSKQLRELCRKYDKSQSLMIRLAIDYLHRAYQKDNETLEEDLPELKRKEKYNRE